MLAAYAAATLVVTWPLAAHLGSAIGGDYGDSTLVAWMMMWAADHLSAVLHGHSDAWAAMWTAPIFAPEPATFTYSEHMIGPALQVLPLRWAGAGPLALYDVALFATIALTGVAAHRLTFRLSGSHVAAATAGVLCTFNDYRFFWSLGHLQTLSIHWWIFALWGLDVFVARGSWAALAGATVALVLLHLSSSYLTAFAAPFTALFVVWSLARHGRLRDQARWMGVVAAGTLSIAAVLPILRRYLETSAALGFTRSIGEVAANSATLAAYRTTLPWLGPLVALALAGAVAPVVGGGLSRRQRLALLLMAGAAVLLSLGPIIVVGGSTWPGPYRLFIDYVPGFSGLRVTHRYVVIVTTLLAVLAGFGAQWLARRLVGAVAVVVAVALVTRTAWATPFPLDREIPAGSLQPPPEYLRPSAVTPSIYFDVRVLPANAVIVEFPFGELAYEVRYTFFTAAHRHRTLNGYSGVLPKSYLERRALLRDPLTDPQSAWQALDGASYAVVHPAAWPDDTGARVREWLESHGARVLQSADGAWLLLLR